MSRRSNICYFFALCTVLTLTGNASTFIGWVLAGFVVLVVAGLILALTILWLKTMMQSMAFLYIGTKGLRWLHRG